MWLLPDALGNHTSVNSGTQTESLLPASGDGDLDVGLQEPAEILFHLLRI